MPPSDSLDTRAAARPEPVTLRGRFVALAPLDPATHGPALFAASHGPEAPGLWAYKPDGPFADEAAFTRHLEASAGQPDRFYFVILDAATAAPLGWAAYLAIRPVHRAIEVGDILFSPALQRRPGGTEAMYLMARHAFETLRYRRYEWKCDRLNAASCRAAIRLGFTAEGVFRRHMIVKGANRDTAWFAMTDEDWPRIRKAMEAWLAPANFDPSGRQKAPLSAV